MFIDFFEKKKICLDAIWKHFMFLYARYTRGFGEKGHDFCFQNSVWSIIDHRLNTWRKVVKGGEFKSKTEFDFLIISIFYKNWSKVIKNGRFEPEIDMNYLTNNLESMGMARCDVNNMFT